MRETAVCENQIKHAICNFSLLEKDDKYNKDHVIKEPKREKKNIFLDI